jgi:hypothetical protein
MRVAFPQKREAQICWKVNLVTPERRLHYSIEWRFKCSDWKARDFTMFDDLAFLFSAMDDFLAPSKK